MRIRATPISPGVAEGNAFIYRDILTRNISSYSISRSEVQAEMARIEHTIDSVKNELDTVGKRMSVELTEGEEDILFAQRLMLDDRELSSEFEREMRGDLVNAEQVTRNVFGRYISRFDESANEAVRSKADDLRDLLRRMLCNLLGVDQCSLQHAPPGSVVVARRLLPSDTIHLSRQNIVAFAVEEGSQHSHSAFVARSLSIPAVCSCGQTFESVKGGERLIVDALDGALIVNPDERQLQAYEKRRDRFARERPQPAPIDHRPVVTGSGVPISIYANANNVFDIEAAAKTGADGIGLFRLETFYLENCSMPSESLLRDYLARIFAPMRDKPLTIRLLDIGGDKSLPYFPVKEDVNPDLGLRGVRILLKYPELLRTQVRAALSLMRSYSVRLLIPMVTRPWEVTAVREIMADCAAGSGIAPENLPPIGSMIETPAAALEARELTALCDFVSVGTNDLLQYLMAAGRENPSVADYYEQGGSLVVRLVADIATACRDAGAECSVCGELAGDPERLRAFIRNGVTAFSVSPQLVPAQKAAVRAME